MNKVKLSSIIDIISGGTPKTDVKQFWVNGNIGWLSVTDFNNDLRYVYTTEKKITEQGLKNSNTKLLNKGDIIISARGTVGALAQIGTPMCFNQSCFGIRGKREIVETDFLYYSLKNYVHNIKKRSQGSVFDTINLNSFDLMEIEIPKELETQQKIASVLSSLDAKIELNNRINAELEAMAKTLYDYWFVQFDFPDKNGKPYKTSGGKMVLNEELKREVPEGWEVKKLFVEMELQYGFPFDTTRFTDEVTDKPVIRIRDILENTISTYSTEDVNDKYRLQQKDLLIGMDGNFHLNFWDKGGAYLNQRSVRIRSKQNSTVSNFQAYFELSPYIKAREKNVSRTTVGHLSDKDLKRLFVTSSVITNDFKPKETFDSFLGKIITNRLENQKLTELRDWLLPMLMNGQVQVSAL